MKSTFFNLFIVLCLVYCLVQLSNATIPYGTVDVKAASRVTFATGKATKPSAACCSGLQQLAQNAKTVDDRKAICRCLKAGIKNFGGVQDRFLSKIPASCGINVGFPVSVNTDCEKVH